jgi:hypothetical protein
MKVLLILFVLNVFISSCYGNDDDPGSTTYCKTIGKERKDEGCKRKPNAVESYYTNVILGAVSRCTDPNSVRDLQGNCFVSSKSDLFQKIYFESEVMKSSTLNSIKISKSENLSIASICLQSSPSLNSVGTLEQSIFEYDPNIRSAVKVLRYQDPSNLDNTQRITNRPSAQNGYLVPLEINSSITARWLVTFSGLLRFCYPRAYQEINQQSYYQIIEVTE